MYLLDLFLVLTVADGIYLDYDGRNGKEGRDGKDGKDGGGI